MPAWFRSRTISPAGRRRPIPRATQLAEMRAGRRQAQRPRQCRLHGPPSHLLRDAGEFLLRRLFQGACDRACLAAGDRGVRACRRIGLSSPSMPMTTKPSTCGGRSRGCRNRASSVSRPATISGRWATPVRAGRRRKSSTIMARIFPAGRRGARTRKATASSRSGISFSCSSIRSRASSVRLCRGHRSTPAWGWSASPPSCRASTTITTSISSRR